MYNHSLHNSNVKVKLNSKMQMFIPIMSIEYIFRSPTTTTNTPKEKGLRSKAGVRLAKPLGHHVQQLLTGVNTQTASCTRFTDCTATRTVPRQVLSDNNSACRGSVPVALVSVERTVPRQILPISILIRFKVSSIKLTD